MGFKFYLVLFGIFAFFSRSSVADSSVEGKTFLVFVNPVGLLVGVTDVGADIAVSDHFSVGPEFLFIDSKTVLSVSFDTHVTGSGYGLRGSWQFGDHKANGEGWVATAFFINVPNYKVVQTPNSFSQSIFGTTTFSGSESYSIFGATGGYRWIWNQLTLKLAGGVGYNTLPKTLILKPSAGTGTSDFSTKGGVNFVGELALGVMF